MWTNVTLGSKTSERFVATGPIVGLSWEITQNFHGTLLRLSITLQYLSNRKINMTNDTTLDARDNLTHTNTTNTRPPNNKSVKSHLNKHRKNYITGTVQYFQSTNLNYPKMEYDEQCVHQQP